MTVRILLVDDNATFLATIRKCLSFLPEVLIVDEAHNGHEALSKAMQLQPDLVLMDIVMPEMSGLEAARVMQQWAHPPRIVFLSMHDNESYHAAVPELGVLAFVNKADFVAELMPLISTLKMSPTEVPRDET